MSLTEQQIERYSRHIILESVGGAGQEKLLSSRVLIVGAGGLGAPAALYLAAAGVGTIGLLDGDEVDLTNLQRQIVHHTSDVGRRKIVSAAEKLRAINPDVTVRTYDTWARANNIRDIIPARPRCARPQPKTPFLSLIVTTATTGGYIDLRRIFVKNLTMFEVSSTEYDFVIDGVDNFAAKFLINDACYFERIPFSHAGILQFEGQLMTVLPGRTACYRCLFRSPPPAGSVPSCGQAGVLGVLPGVVGSLQATEAIKYLLELGDLLTDSLLTYNALKMDFRKIGVGRSPNCPLCGADAEIKELVDAEAAVCDRRGCQCQE